MILSVSRRTDIPSFYSSWFLNRIKDGYLYVRNPMSQHQVSKINITPDVVDCIVFWTKNPIPMIDRLDELKDYQYYFQFTLTAYDKDIEANLPDKRTVLIPAFKKLSEKIGKERVIWRYDPIIFNDKYMVEYHLNTFNEFAHELKGYTEKCVISFLDMYPKIQRNMQTVKPRFLPTDQLKDFSKQIADIAHECGMSVATCSEQIDLEFCGIEHNACIDKNLIEKLIGYDLKVDKDKGQRNACGCYQSTDIGTYNTCQNGCKYCYANFSQDVVNKSCMKYSITSPILCDSIDEQLDRISERKVKSLKVFPSGGTQINLFDVMGDSKK